jgi:hypothetical protein
VTIARWTQRRNQLSEISFACLQTMKPNWTRCPRRTRHCLNQSSLPSKEDRAAVQYLHCVSLSRLKKTTDQVIVHACSGMTLCAIKMLHDWQSCERNPCHSMTSTHTRKSDRTHERRTLRFVRRDSLKTGGLTEAKMELHVSKRLVKVMSLVLRKVPPHGSSRNRKTILAKS